MNPEQIRARLAEIHASLEGIQAGDNGYSAEQLQSIESLNSEFDNLSGQLEASEKVASMKARASGSAGRKTTSAAPTATEAGVPRASGGAPRNERFGGFENSGQWLMAVKNAGKGGKMDDRLQNALMRESVGEDGGFLVPEEIGQAITTRLDADDSLMAKTTSLQVSGNSLSLNIDEKQPWNGGIEAYWIGEGKKFKDSAPSFETASWRLNKLGVLVHSTDELLEDATALESYIKAAAPEAIMHKVNSAILTGNGVGKPTGILNSPFAVTVAKESAQPADTVNAMNIIKMYSRMIPSARAKAAWYVNPAVEEQLLGMKDANGNFIYLSPGGQLNQSPYGLLLGRPVIPLMAGTPALGDVGDIMLADLSYYYMIRKAQGVKSATSIHLHFDREITSFRFSMRVDGRSPFKSPVTTENGNYQMSAFVLLEAR